jgi:hypothetical protein
MNHVGYLSPSRHLFHVPDSGASVVLCADKGKINVIFSLESYAAHKPLGRNKGRFSDNETCATEGSLKIFHDIVRDSLGVGSISRHGTHPCGTLILIHTTRKYTLTNSVRNGDIANVQRGEKNSA